MKIDSRCNVCPIGVNECIKRIESRIGMKPKKLRPAHPWVIEWCPYLRGFKPQSP